MDFTQCKITTFVVYQKDLTCVDAFPLGEKSAMFEIMKASRMTNKFMLIMSKWVNHFSIIGDIDDDVRMLLAFNFQEITKSPYMLIEQVMDSTKNWPEITHLWDSEDWATVSDYTKYTNNIHLQQCKDLFPDMNCHFLNYYVGVFSLNHD